MNFIKSKKFWISALHIAIIGAGATVSVFFPPAAWAIMSGTGLINAVLPSPLTK